jgi:acylglycerol lipase
MTFEARQHGWFPGTGGVALHTQTWLPENTARGRVVVAHGLGNHSGGYTALAEALVADGYSVHAMDQRGHGRSSGPPLAVTRFADLVADLRSFIALVHPPDSAERVFLFGHSWGALLSLAYAASWQNEIDGLVLCAPGIRPTAATPEQIAAVRALAQTAPDAPAVELNFDKLSRDPLVQEAFNNDPLVYRGKIPAQMAVETLNTIGDVSTKLALVTLPILLMHGTDDQIAAPEGSQFIYDNVGSVDRTIALYDGLWHQLFNEPERDTVLTDLAGWLDSHSHK